jgi:uncharacterized membrane protein
MPSSYMPKHRLDALVDAVIAITMTLLVLELRMPEELSDGLFGAISHLEPKFISWIISFVILALYWRWQMQATVKLEHVDKGLFWIMVFWLLTTSVIPFSSSVLGDYNDNPQAHLIYGLSFVAVQAVVLVRNWYLRTHPQLFEGGDTSKAELGFSGPVAVTLAAVIAVGWAYLVQPDYATIAYVLVMPFNRLIERFAFD